MNAARARSVCQATNLAAHVGPRHRREMGRITLFGIAILLAAAGEVRADDPVLHLDGRGGGGRDAAASPTVTELAFGDKVERSTVDAALRGRMVPIQKCLLLYHWRVKEGDVVVLAIIAPSGKPTKVEAGGHDPTAVGCVKKAIAALRLPKTARGGAVATTIHLESKSKSLTKALEKFSGKADTTGVAGLGPAGGVRPDESGVGTLDRAKPAPPAGRVMLEDPDVQPGADRDVIVRVVTARAGILRACYEQELARRKTLAGTVTVVFTIGTAGAVSAARADKGIDPKVDACVASQIQRMTFPRRARELVVRYPVTFSRSTP